MDYIRNLGEVMMDDLEYMRDKKLIEEYEKYEEKYFKEIIEDDRDEKLMEEVRKLEKDLEDTIEDVIEDRLFNLHYPKTEFIEDNFYFASSPQYNRLEELHYEYCDIEYQRQINDVNDYIDYPDGPDENLEGVLFDEHYRSTFNFEMDDSFIEYKTDDILISYEDFELEDSFLEYNDTEKRHTDYLIEHYYIDEKESLNDILNEFPDGNNCFEKTINEQILDEAGIDYEP